MHPILRGICVSVYQAVASWRRMLSMSDVGRARAQYIGDKKLYTNFTAWCLQATDQELLEVLARPELERSKELWGMWLIEHGYVWRGSDEWLAAVLELRRRREAK